MNHLKGILPTGSYKKIAKTIGKSEGTVAQYFSNSEQRISAKTEFKILEQAERIIKETVLKYIREKKANVAKKIKEKSAIAA